MKFLSVPLLEHLSMVFSFVPFNFRYTAAISTTRRRWSTNLARNWTDIDVARISFSTVRQCFLLFPFRASVSQIVVSIVCSTELHEQNLVRDVKSLCKKYSEFMWVTFHRFSDFYVSWQLDKKVQANTSFLVPWNFVTHYSELSKYSFDKNILSMGVLYYTVLYFTDKILTNETEILGNKK